MPPCVEIHDQHRAVQLSPLHGRVHRRSLPPSHGQKIVPICEGLIFWGLGCPGVVSEDPQPFSLADLCATKSIFTSPGSNDKPYPTPMCHTKGMHRVPKEGLWTNQRSIGR